MNYSQLIRVAKTDRYTSRS